MKCRIIETNPTVPSWRHVEQHSPQTTRYMADPNDKGVYRCFVAIADRHEFAGLCVIAIAPLGFGPLAKQTVACLENILVPRRHRRQGIGTALLQRSLAAAWRAHAAHLWWTADYDNRGAIAFYKSMGAVFIAEEDPAADHPLKCYTVVIPNPKALGTTSSFQRKRTRRKR